MMRARELLTCECNSTEHTVIINLDKFSDDLGVQMWVEVHLSRRDPWYKRLWHGIKYIFGYKSKYGDFDDFWLTKSEANKLLKMTCKFLKEAKY